MYYIPTFDYEREGYRVLGRLDDDPEIATVGYKGRVVFWFPEIGIKVDEQTLQRFLRNLFDLFNLMP